MKDIKVIRGKRGYVLDLISQGEHEQQDFKYAISDARKIARSISAFANRAGGSLLIGVKDNGVIAGVRNDEDIYVIEQAAQMYCQPAQEVTFEAFSTGDTGIVIRANVPKTSMRPVLAQEHDKSWRAYYRVADENIAVHPLMIRAWRRQNSDVRDVFKLDGAETALLHALNRQQSMTINEALLAAAVSKRTAESAIVRLAAMGLIEFEHQGSSGFVLVLPKD